MKIYGTPLVFGTVEPLPLRHFPAGKTRVRMRKDDFATVIVRTADGVREWYVTEEDGYWCPCFEKARNKMV